MQNLSACRASRGKSSLMRTPGTEGAIGFNSPRISAGASGLRSQVSSCGGPPVRKSNTHRFARANPASAVDEVGAARNQHGRDSPRHPSAPTRKKSRRDVPSHRRFGGPVIANMVNLVPYDTELDRK